MKKRSRLSRALSILLAMLMILSNSAITTYADIIGGVSQQSAGTFTYDDNEKTVTEHLKVMMYFQVVHN